MSTTLHTKELAQLQRRFKKGYTVELGRGGHYRVYDPEGQVVRVDGRPIIIPSTPTSSSTERTEAKLRAAGVLRSAPRKGRVRVPVDQAKKARTEALLESTRVRAQGRQVVATALHDRLAKVIDVVGGFNQPGNLADMAHIGALIARGNGHPDMTPDLLTGSIHRVKESAWVTPEYQAIWNEFARQLEEADVISTEYFRLVRQARNIPEPETFVSTQLHLPSSEWPFAVILIDIDHFFLDHSYQRPPFWPFIRKIAASFDETLVGAIDVSDRGGRYAIMDGQLRFEAMRLVGKKTAWASVYAGLDPVSEARFFLKKNRDRKAIHPYYTWKAKLTALEPDAVAVNKITKAFGYRIWMTSAGGIHDDANISAIAACEDAYSRHSDTRPECLTPTLEVLKAATFGRRQGQATTLIRGLGRFFQLYDNVDMERLIGAVAERGPEWLVGRAREEARGSGSAQMLAMVRVLVYEYNRTLGRDERGMRLKGP